MDLKLIELARAHEREDRHQRLQPQQGRAAPRRARPQHQRARELPQAGGAARRGDEGLRHQGREGGRARASATSTTAPWWWWTRPRRRWAGRSRSASPACCRPPPGKMIFCRWPEAGPSPRSRARSRLGDRRELAQRARPAHHRAPRDGAPRRRAAGRPGRDPAHRDSGHAASTLSAAAPDDRTSPAAPRRWRAPVRERPACPMARWTVPRPRPSSAGRFASSRTRSSADRRLHGWLSDYPPSPVRPRRPAAVGPRA